MSVREGWDEFCRAAGPDKVSDLAWFAFRFRSGEVMCLNLTRSDESRINEVLMGGSPPMCLTWRDWDGVAATYYAYRIPTVEEREAADREAKTRRQERIDLHEVARDQAPWRVIGSARYRMWSVPGGTGWEMGEECQMIPSGAMPSAHDTLITALAKAGVGWKEYEAAGIKFRAYSGWALEEGPLEFRPKQGE